MEIQTILQLCAYYLDEVFYKILKKLSTLKKKIISHINGLLIFIEIKQKKKKLKKKIKMADSKKTHFSAPPILNIFLLKLHGLVLGLVGLIDA